MLVRALVQTQEDEIEFAEFDGRVFFLRFYATCRSDELKPRSLSLAIGQQLVCLTFPVFYHHQKSTNTEYCCFHLYLLEEVSSAYTCISLIVRIRRHDVSEQSCTWFRQRAQPSFTIYSVVAYLAYMYLLSCVSDMFLSARGCNDT